MLLYLLLTTFPWTFIIKGNFNNGRNPPSCPFPDIAFINEEVTGCINEKKHRCYQWNSYSYHHRPKKPTFLSFISCFTDSVATSINRPDFYIDSTILIISSISLFEINEADLFLVLTTPFPLIFISILSNTYCMKSV